MTESDPIVLLELQWKCLGKQFWCLQEENLYFYVMC